MPNLDLKGKSFPVPEKLVTLAKGNKSLSYSNMKKMKSELDGKENKGDDDTKLLQWINTSLDRAISKIKRPKDIRMDLGYEGTKDSVSGGRNNHKKGTEKVSGKNKPMDTGTSPTKLATSGREITNNVVNAGYEKEIKDMLYLIEYLNKT